MTSIRDGSVGRITTKVGLDGAVIPIDDGTTPKAVEAQQLVNVHVHPWARTDDSALIPANKLPAGTVSIVRNLIGSENFDPAQAFRFQYTAIAGVPEVGFGWLDIGDTALSSQPNGFVVDFAKLHALGLSNEQTSANSTHSYYLGSVDFGASLTTHYYIARGVNGGVPVLMFASSADSGADTAMPLSLYEWQAQGAVAVVAVLALPDCLSSAVPLGLLPFACRWTVALITMYHDSRE